MRCLDLIDVECEAAPRWGETSRALLSAATGPLPTTTDGEPHERSNSH
jgi:4-hydroxy-3-polyprenylbenzoate decarboxylase